MTRRRRYQQFTSRGNPKHSSRKRKMERIPAGDGDLIGKRRSDAVAAIIISGRMEGVMGSTEVGRFRWWIWAWWWRG